jgi:hypothetical protein
MKPSLHQSIIQSMMLGAEKVKGSSIAVQNVTKDFETACSDITVERSSA